MRRKAASQSQEREPRDGRVLASPSPPARPQKSRPGGRAQSSGRPPPQLVDMDNDEPV